MLVVRVLTVLSAVSAHKKVTANLIDADQALHMPGALRQLADQRAVRPVPIDMRPAVALGPPQKVSIGELDGGARFHVGIEAVFDDRRHRTRGGIRDHDVGALPVPRDSGEQELVRAVGEPL